ncbi:MAG: hypothetical protein ACHQNE_08570, partial [Candidatus Kapaibacterium sp.]
MKSFVFVVLISAVLGEAGMAQSPRFLENKGQWDTHAKYLLHSGNVNVWITDSGMVYDIYRCVA